LFTSKLIKKGKLAIVGQLMFKKWFLEQMPLLLMDFMCSQNIILREMAANL